MIRGRFRRWAVTLSALALCSTAPLAAEPDVRALTQAYNQSGQELFRALAADPGNVVLSPLSIGTAMAMALSGARGETEAEMRQVLQHTLTGPAIEEANAKALAALLAAGEPTCPDGFKPNVQLCEAPAPADKDAGCPHAARRDGALCVTEAREAKATLRIANALMLVNPSATLADAYRDTVRKHFNAEIFPGANLATVNNWVKEKTEGKIPTILDRLNPQDSHVLLNAVYFKAPWALAFAENATRDREFHLTATQTADVPTMSQTAAFAIEKGDGYQAIRLPYKRDGLSMIIVRPDEVDGIDKVIAGFDAAKLDALTQALLKAQKRQVALSLPKFKFEFAADLIAPFKALGMRKVFDPAQSDLSGLTGQPREKAQSTIDQIAHRAVIEVAEEGTEAAAATAVVVTTRTMAPGHQPERFTVDRPFMFVIADDKTGAILFAGRVSDPRS
ncbi:serpin family protein [Pseudorhodoplanes sp.]|uniref:serpin family protein n=1 Tax=Pseudorhodoplanes sp. TaxID=1934341 RepID=UPI002B55A52C|nr:serpin family protein [Pseudorhodoplanes sp.]HWV53011.1 serpin family protein [Pseudorhodoplanes sp.]